MPYGTQLLLQIHVFLYSYRKHSLVMIYVIVYSQVNSQLVDPISCGCTIIIVVIAIKQNKQNQIVYIQLWLSIARYDMCGKCMKVYINRCIQTIQLGIKHVTVQACILATMERGVKVGIMACVFFIISGCFSIPTIIYIIHSGSQDHHHITTARDILYRLNVNDCPQKVRIGIHVQLNLIAS